MAVDEKIAVSLAQDVYHDQGRPPLPSGWTVFLNCCTNKTEESDGYYGAAYQAEIDSRHAAIVIAHRGSDSLEDWIEDVEMCSAISKTPKQFYTGAIPFIQDVFLQLDKAGYNQTVTYLYFTGHSLGATLAELSIIRYIHYFDPGKFTHNPYRIWGNTTYVFESPGSLNLAEEQVAKREIQQADIKDGGKTIEVYNSEVDAINTCMPTAAAYGRRRIFTAIGNEYSYTWRLPFLPYHADNGAFYAHYSLSQHKIAYVYDWVTQVFDRSNPNTYTAIKVSEWPISLEAALYNYLSYYGPGAPNHNFEKHNLYWQQYTTILWNQDPALHEKFNNDLSAFQYFYYKSELHYTGGYFLGNIDLATFPSVQGFIVKTSPDYDPYASSVSGIGDVNQDNIPDLLIGVSHHAHDIDGWSPPSEAFVVYGGQSGVIDLSSFPSNQGFVIKDSRSTNGINSVSGRIVSGTGDINGDGIADFMVTDGGYNGGNYFDERTYLIYGGQGGIIDLAHFSSNQGIIILNTYCNIPANPDSISGAGDLNGDGIPDLLLGFPWVDVTCEYWPDGGSGAVYGVYGGQSGVIDLTYFPNNQGFVIRGTPGQYIGQAISGTGDVNGDKIPDLLVSGNFVIDNSTVGAYLVYGGQSGTIELKNFPNAQGCILKANPAFPEALEATLVSGTGDINGDGTPDLFVMPPINDAFVVYGGNLNGIVDLDLLTNYQGIRIRGMADWTDRDSISGLGDVNGDGFADLLLIGNVYEYESNGYYPTSYVVYGGRNGIIHLANLPFNDQGFMIGSSASIGSQENSGSGTGDLNRDGLPDIFLGVDYLFGIDGYVGYGVYSRRSPALHDSSNTHTNIQKQIKNNSAETESKPVVSENRFLNLYNMAGQQFNTFYQQAKEYLASFWRAETFQVKAELSAAQVRKREIALDKILEKLDLLEAVLDLDWHDNKDYLKKVTNFYQKMVSNWKGDVSTLAAQDIRDLQEDISKISHAVYSPDTSYLAQKTEQKNPYGFFAGAGINASVSYPVLAAQPVPLLP